MARPESEAGQARREALDERATNPEVRVERRVGDGLDERAAALLELRVAGVLAERRQALQRRFGWAGPVLRCAVEPRRRTLALVGEALSRKALAAALAELGAALPAGWRIDAAGTEIAAPRAWFALPAGVTRLWRAPPAGVIVDGCVGICPSEHVLKDVWAQRRGSESLSWHVSWDMFDSTSASGRGGRPAALVAAPICSCGVRECTGGRSGGVKLRGYESSARALFDRDRLCPDEHVLEDMRFESAACGRAGWCPDEHVCEDMEMCTELLADDGPVGVLAAGGGWALVRARDGTIGWTRARLGALVAVASRTTPARGEVVALTRVLRRFRGAPYRLGGTTPLGIDCSGLVQRAVRAALGVVLPRHSSDQLALAASPVRPLGEPGDLLFMWGAGESPCHVGVVLRGARAGARTLLHASSRRGRVIEEPLEQVLPRASRVRHMELEQVLALGR
ncbi:NlpC/P60 family protein [Nannocystis punicea]|uniref:NlpC/P60 family protein n=1 Tax=Nannocystis punicea TaxID=2995304 RepID=A0ABY7HDG0_9BACT|nr:NlpC/P60 family protein [Nannocystis poenicansa]WAS97120.1 NlpC/P60 family protein [Nannocystis poenicansa]